jgi:peptide/nickel transport system permease protein
VLVLGLKSYIAKRVLLFIPLVIGMTMLTFIMSNVLPGDPITVHLGGSPSAEAIQIMRIKLGFDKPLWIQYFVYMGNLLQGNLGISYMTGNTVLYDMEGRLFATMELGFVTVFLTILIGVPLGIASAFKKNSAIDHIARFIGVSGVSIPSFWLGLVLIFLFYFMLRIFPAPLGRLPPGVKPPTSITGFYIIDSALTGNWKTLSLSLSNIALPALAGIIVSIAPITRMTRSAIIDVLEKDYIKAARAAGVPERQIVGDALKNAMIPILTICGLSVGFMLSGSIIIEKVFSWPGIGLYSLQSMTANDHDPMMAYVLIVGLFFAAVNLVTDLLYGVVDPRIKYG